MPTGPILPRKDTALARARETLGIAAYQIGVVVAVQRTRANKTQEQLAEDIGADAHDISELENGRPFHAEDAALDALFQELDLDEANGFARFLGWWRDNSHALTRR